MNTETTETTETTEDPEARRARERAERDRRQALDKATLALARACGFPEPDRDFFFDPGQATGYVVGGRRSRLWHADEACAKAPAGNRCTYGAPVLTLDAAVYEWAKADPCPACTLPALLAVQLRAATEPDVVAELRTLEHAGPPTQYIVTCRQFRRERHDRCPDCARLAAAAATVGAPVHRDGDGFTVVAVHLLWRSMWSFRRTFAVHVPPKGFTGPLGVDGLTAAWTLRSDAPQRLVEPRRNEWTGMVDTFGGPAWTPAELIVPPGT